MNDITQFSSVEFPSLKADGKYFRVEHNYKIDTNNNMVTILTCKDRRWPSDDHIVELRKMSLKDFASLLKNGGKGEYNVPKELEVILQ